VARPFSEVLADLDKAYRELLASGKLTPDPDVMAECMKAGNDFAWMKYIRA
jgi:hypothetical protein